MASALYAGVSFNDDEEGCGEVAGRTIHEQVEQLEYKEKHAELRKEHERCTEELKAARAEAAQLAERNKVLERNICCLYETAKKELERKDVLMGDLRDQVKALTLAQRKKQRR